MLTQITNDNFEPLVKKGKEPTLILVSHPKCSPCKQIKPGLANLERTRTTLPKDFSMAGGTKIMEVDVTEVDYKNRTPLISLVRDIRNQIKTPDGKMTFPALALVKEGKILKIRTGYADTDTIESMVEQALDPVFIPNS